MTTFNPTEKDAAAIEARPRAFSQDNLKNEGDMLEVKTISCKEAMSQYICHHKSDFNDDTESDVDDEFEESPTKKRASIL